MNTEPQTEPGYSKDTPWWRRVFGFSKEVFIIFISITLSFLFDEWREDRKQREQERFFLQQIKQDITEDLTELRSDLQQYKALNQAFGYFRGYERNKKASPDSLRIYLDYFFYEVYPLINNAGYTVLSNSGKLDIISNKMILSKLLDIQQDKLPALQSSINGYLAAKNTIILPYLYQHVVINRKTKESNLPQLLNETQFQNIVRVTPEPIINRYTVLIERMESLAQEIDKELKK